MDFLCRLAIHEKYSVILKRKKFVTFLQKTQYITLFPMPFSLMSLDWNGVPLVLRG